MLSLPATEFEFPGQGPHAAADTAAVLALYKLSPQSVQGVEPETSLYDPAAHAEHGPPFAPVYPALQMQAVAIVDAIGDCEFAGHV